MAKSISGLVLYLLKPNSLQKIKDGEREEILSLGTKFVPRDSFF